MISLQVPEPTKNLRKKKFKDFFLSYRNELEMSDLIVDAFKMTLLNALQNTAPVRKKYLRANLSKFVNKAPSKAMMQRTKLRHKFFQPKTTETKYIDL